MTETGKKLYKDLDALGIRLQNWESNGLNDPGFYIFHYAPGDELALREEIEKLIKKANDRSPDFSVIAIDLYEAMLSLINEEGFLEKCFSFEGKQGIEYLKTKLDALFGVLNPSSSIYINYLAQKAPKNGALFLTGVGKVFPFIRSHWVLQNLAPRLMSMHRTTPVILFFPGDYSGLELKLFAPDMPIDSNHYRAISLN
jgi:hypothetical protein